MSCPSSSVLWWDLAILIAVLVGSYLLIRFESQVVKVLRWLLRVGR